MEQNGATLNIQLDSMSQSNTPNRKNDLENPPNTSHPALENPSSDDYEPHAYGKQRNPTIFWGPILHLLKYIIGTGVFTLPYAFQEVGYGFGIFGTLLVSLFYTHLIHLLLEVEYDLCKKLKTPNLTYVNVVQHSFEQGPRFTRRLTPIAKFLIYFHYLFNKSIMNAVYLITISSNFKMIIDYYYDINSRLFVIMTAVMMPLIGLCLIRDLKFLVPLSMVTNLFNIFNLVLILFVPTDQSAPVGIKAVNDISKFPNFCTTILGSLECTGLSLPMKKDMEKPKRFTDFFGVLNITLSTAAVLYGTFGVLGMLKYGDRLKPNILFNLPPKHLSSLVILSLQSFALCISFVLFIYIGVETISNNLFNDKKVKNTLIFQYGLRIAPGILAYLMAVALPDFKIMITLTFTVGIIVDEAMLPILHAILLVKQKSKSTRTYFILIKDIVLILICLYILIATLIDIIASIVKYYS